MRRLYSLWIPLIVTACASGPTAGGPAVSASERQKVVNLVPFDIANCFPQKMDLGKTANEYTLQAAFRAARPAIQECLADGRNISGSGAKGKAAMTLDGTGTRVVVSSEGLQPAGTSCIEKAIRSQLEAVKPPGAGKPLTLEGPFERDASSTVRMGINESSDVVGTIRMALPQWCSCFEAFRTQIPSELIGPVDIVRPDVAKFVDRFKQPDGGVRTNNPVVAGLQAAEPSAAQAASCVNDKIGALTFKITPEQLIVPVHLLLVNSNSTQAYSPAAPPPLQFAQLDSVRGQREAEAFAALTRRQNVANAYDMQVQTYQALATSKDAKKRKTAGAMVKDLKAGCAALVKADDDYTHALEAELAVEQQAVSLAQELKVKDPAWGDAEKASTGAAAETQKQIDAAKQLRAANDKACPKEKF